MVGSGQCAGTLPGTRRSATRCHAIRTLAAGRGSTHCFADRQQVLEPVAEDLLHKTIFGIENCSKEQLPPSGTPPTSSTQSSAGEAGVRTL